MHAKWTPDARHKFHRMANIKVAFDFLKNEKISLVNVRPEDIEVGNLNSLLSLIWIIILRYHICKSEEISTKAQNEKKKEIINWVQKQLSPYKVQVVKDLTTSFQSGVALSALFCSMSNTIVDFEQLDVSDPIQLNKDAIALSEIKYQIPPLISGEDVTNSPDDLSMWLYLSYYHDTFVKISV